VGDVSVDEGNAGVQRVNVDLTLSSARTTPVQVDFDTADDSATEGSDYNQSSGTLTFQPGDTTKSIELEVKGDTIDEPDERFLVNLSNPSGVSLADTQGAVTIKDDDAPPTAPGSGGPGGSGQVQGQGQIVGGKKSGCALPTGSVRGRRLGRARLGGSRASERRVLPGLRKPRPTMDRFCMGRRHLRIGYASRGLLSRLGRSRRDRAARRAVLILVSHTHYRIRGVRAGSSVRSLRRRLHGLRTFRIGANRWYIARGGGSRLVFKTRRRRVLEVGIADLRLTQGRLARPFLRSFPG
jgi:hypothetical protein